MHMHICSMKRVERVERAAATTGAAACRVLRVTRVEKSSQHRHDCECDAPVVTYQVWRQLCTRRQDLRLFSSLENVFTCLFSTATCVVVIDGAALVLVWITWHGKEAAHGRVDGRGAVAHSRREKGGLNHRLASRWFRDRARCACMCSLSSTTGLQPGGSGKRAHAPDRWLGDADLGEYLAQSPNPRATARGLRKASTHACRWEMQSPSYESALS